MIETQQIMMNAAANDYAAIVAEKLMSNYLTYDIGKIQNLN